MFRQLWVRDTGESVDTQAGKAGGLFRHAATVVSKLVIILYDQPIVFTQNSQCCGFGTCT